MTPNLVKGSNSLPGDRYDHPNHPKNNPAYHPSGYTPASERDQDQNQSNMSSGMDGDHSAKTMDAGANAASNVSDMSEGIHEDAKQGVSCLHISSLRIARRGY